MIASLQPWQIFAPGADLAFTLSLIVFFSCGFVLSEAGLVSGFFIGFFIGSGFFTGFFIGSGFFTGFFTGSGFFALVVDAAPADGLLLSSFLVVLIGFGVGLVTEILVEVVDEGAVVAGSMWTSFIEYLKISG